MSETLNTNPTEQPPQLDPAVQSLANMADKMGEGAGIGEKYYEQARAMRDSWVELSREILARAQEKTPKGLRVLVFPENGSLWDRQRATGTRPLDENSVEDMARFNEYKNNEIQSAIRSLEEDQNYDLDEIARSFKNQEIIEQIAVKLENDEDFTEEEREFLGEAPISDEEVIDFDKFIVADKLDQRRRQGLMTVPYYWQLLDVDDGWGEVKDCPHWATVARAQMREAFKQDRAILHNNEEIQNTLENMEKLRIANPFFGETNVNSATGESRTFDLEDSYPRLEGESEEAYATRLKRIGLKTRLAEKRQ